MVFLLGETKLKCDLTAFRPVSFPAIEPSKSTPFECYLQKKPGNEVEAGQEFSALPTFIAGEAETMEFFSSDETERASVGSTYV
jgi:DNA-directed RNA polymerase I subunit RPA49